MKNHLEHLHQLRSPAPVQEMVTLPFYTNPRNCTALVRALNPDYITAQKLAGLLFLVFFFPRQLKANLIRVNDVVCGLQGFKLCLFNIIFFLKSRKHEPVSNLHMKVTARYQKPGQRRLCVCVCVRACVLVYWQTRVTVHCLHFVWRQRDSVITPAASEWRSLLVLRSHFTPGSGPDRQL